MKLVNSFDITLTISTFNAGDVLEWIPYRVYHATPNSIVDVRAHDHGRCKIRIDWSQYGGRELGVHSDSEILLLEPARRPDIPVERGESGEPRTDEIADFLRNHWELVRQYYFDLPGHRYEPV